MSYSNGANHQNVEQLLASIRSHISDSHPFAGNGSNTARKENVRPQPTPVTDDPGEFELPAIFRADRPAPRSNGTRLGRLSEALSNVTTPRKPTEAEQPSSTVIHLTPPASRLAQTQQAAPAKAPTQPVSSEDDDTDWRAATERATSANGNCQRKMASFCDTRMNSMGGMSSMSGPPQAEVKPAEVAVEPQVQESPPVPTEPQVAKETTQASANDYVADRSAGLQLPMPPPLPATNAVVANAPEMDDVAAQMLRPILRQWLTENMPKIVEKALRSEAGIGEPQVPSQTAVNTASDGRQKD